MKQGAKTKQINVAIISFICGAVTTRGGGANLRLLTPPSLNLS